MPHTREIYLDQNATTCVLPIAAAAAQQVMAQFYGNPSSSHITGLKAKHILEETRNTATQIFHAKNHNIIFTSGATEAIQTAILSALLEIKKSKKQNDKPRLLLYGATEHKAVPQALKHWNKILEINNTVMPIPVDHNGQIDLAFLKANTPHADIICTMAVNNETGVIHDLQSIDTIIRANQQQHVYWLADCVQALGKIPIDFSQLTIDYAAFSGHKVYAPKGVGMLLFPKDAPLTPLIAGGGQEQGFRSGTENLPGVAALGAILQELNQPKKNIFRTHHQLIDFRLRFINSLTHAFPEIVFNTPLDCAVPTTLNFAVAGFTSKEIMDLFDAADLRVSSGSACGSALVASYVLDAMGIDQWRSQGAIRLSFGPAITDQQVTAACQRIQEAGQSLTASCLSLSNANTQRPPSPTQGLIQLKKGSDVTYIIYDQTTKHCIIIDPFQQFLQRIHLFVQCKNANVLAVLDTHGHVDHQSPRPQLMKMIQKYTTPQAQNANYLGWPDQPHGEVHLPEHQSDAPYIRINPNQILAKITLPGHTKDHQGYLLGKNTNAQKTFSPHDIQHAILGDIIQIGGIGRSDFPASTPEKLLHSLRKLTHIITPNCIICPTHDYSTGLVTTLQAEQKENPFLRAALDPLAPMALEPFLKQKKIIDAQIQDATNPELVCGKINHDHQDASAIDVPPQQLKAFFHQNKDARLIDVRESHEFHFTQDWSALGLQSSPENIPLTQLANALPQILKTQNNPQAKKIIFICRSGARSSKAAQILQRLGAQNVYHIAGGIALNAPIQKIKTLPQPWYSI